ncbi:MAG: glycosyltransferase [Lactimicrobium massiliense]|nr:glycosyltransferase family 2 protein [Lactimicrobium massiliense]MDD6559534.1 glycosyltransferase [Lactimicrobium massiliense]
MTAFLTVFTPAYNRAGTIKRTYQSLLNQDNKDFIWLVIDDGSVDNTGELVKGWMKEDNGFEIQYIYKQNGGMHTAHNTAYKNIHTELNVCIDSDDALAPGAVSSIYYKWQEVKDKGYAGIIGLDADMNTGKVIGTSFPEGMKETTLTGFYAAGGKGDKKLVYRTDVINKYPAYPVFEDEKYVALAYKYRLIDQDYKLAVLNKVLCNVEYQPDGSSATMYQQYVKNPKGFAFWRKVCMQYPESKKRLLIDCMHYVAESKLAGNKHYIQESPRKALTVLMTPAGNLLCKRIKKVTKTNNLERNKYDS